MSDQASFEVIIQGDRVAVSPLLLEKYNRPGPRYTSYPTAPEWDDGFGETELRQAFAEAEERKAPLSLYIHLPFCRSLCLFCGCNVVISKDHGVAVPYVERVKREIGRTAGEISRGRAVHQMHWGGGTPTYLSSEQLEELFDSIRNLFSFAPDAEIGVEIDPRATTHEQCSALRRMGFNRLSMGIQDFNPLVQKTVHRIQPYETTKELFDDCRDLGFDSINIDLIYGLPHQTVDSFCETVDKILEINPDRIALFSYAHVPWMKKQQGSFAPHLPREAEKFRIFAAAILRFTEAGYRYIGLDHFARPDDELCRAQDDRTLHRNFQGYTTKAGCDLYGMGVSSISGIADSYSQNWREIPLYYQAIDSDRWPIMRGIRLTEDDKIRRSIISRILCHCVVIKPEVEAELGICFDEFFRDELDRLRDLERDGLVRLSQDRIEVAALGRIFARNVAMVFDAYLRTAGEKAKLFSRTL